MKTNQQNGVTLVELMIAMTIGLFLLGAIASVYLASKDTYRTSDNVARLQENARLALRILTEDIQMAGFLGNSANPLLIEGRRGTTGQLDTAGNDCSPRWYIDMTSLLVIGNNGTPVVNGTDFGTTCLNGYSLVNAADIIAVKRAATATIDDLADHDDWTILRTDPMRGELFFGGDPEPTGLAPVNSDRRWLAHVYFVATNSDGVPGLHWRALSSGPAFSNRQELVPGIQDVQVQFGVDTNGDGSANQFVEPDAVGSGEVVAARIWVLARSEVREPSHDDSTNTYAYANKSYTPGDSSTDDETETTTNPGQYRRLLLASTVTLRN